MPRYSTMRSIKCFLSFFVLKRVLKRTGHIYVQVCKLSHQLLLCQTMTAVCVRACVCGVGGG
jgi:hypothetical protein